MEHLRHADISTLNQKSPIYQQTKNVLFLTGSFILGEIKNQLFTKW